MNDQIAGVPDWDQFNQKMKREAAEAKELQEAALKAHDQKIREMNREQKLIEADGIRRQKEFHMVGIHRSITNVGDSNWRKSLEVLKAANNELQTYNHLFTPYEREIIKQDIAAKRSSYFSSIYNGVINEVLEPAIQNYKSAQSKAADARANEIKRWEPAKLRDEMQATGMILDGILKTQDNAFSNHASRADQIRQVYEEAVASGDMFKQRAVAEVMRGLPGRSQDKDERIKLTLLESQARQDLARLRSTPEMEAAETKKQEAAKGVKEAMREVINTSMDLGEGDPLGMWASNAFTKPLKQIKQTPTGDFEFLEPNDPEFTGIVWSGAAKPMS